MKHNEVPMSLKVVEKQPLDANAVVKTLAEAVELAYHGYAPFVEDLNKRIEFRLVDGILNFSDAGSGYTHPETHPASMITEEANRRFLTDAQRGLLNNVLPIIQDNYTKLPADYPEGEYVVERIVNANIGVIGHEAFYNGVLTTYTIIGRIQSFQHFITGFGGIYTRYSSGNGWGGWITIYNNINLLNATSVKSGLMTNADKAKLDSIAENATSYTHPETHPASMIAEEANRRFVSDTEKAFWNDKHTRNEIANLISGLLEQIDWKEAVPTFADLATTYPTPAIGWTAYVIDENAKYTYNRDEWVKTSNGDIPLATALINGLMGTTDKAKLDGIAANANNYTHPETHPASMIEQDVDRMFIKGTERAKLANIAENANNYTHPETHPASMITEEADRRFLSDAERYKLSSFVVRQPIGFNENLNDLKTVGFYYCDANQKVATLLNCPTSNSFSLIVEEHAGYTQTLTEYMAGNQKKFTRNYYNNIWSPWYPVHIGNTITVQDIIIS